MDVSLSEEQEFLQQSAREFLEAECPMDLVREQMEAASGVSDSLWTQMAELGWMGLPIPESAGGASLDLLSLALVCQEMGRVLLPAPYLSTVALGARAILLGGTQAQRQALLPALASGSLRVALAQLDEDLTWGNEAIRLPASRVGDDFVLNGVKRFASDAQCADLLIIPARTSQDRVDGITLFLVPVNADGVRVEPVAYNDPTRRVCQVVLEDVTLESSTALGEPDHGGALLERVLDFAKVALCAEMLGGAERVLELSVEYAKSREQFGKPIGSFQAIQHKCANQFMDVESIRSAVFYAAWAVGNDEPDAHLAACLAKSFCGDAYTRVAAEGIQIHGGLGFTWEQDLHLYYKRAKSSQLWLGDAAWNRELAARVMLDG